MAFFVEVEGDQVVNIYDDENLYEKELPVNTVEVTDAEADIIKANDFSLFTVQAGVLNTVMYQRAVKGDEIRNAFYIEMDAPVVVGGISYHGGFDSALKLDGAKRLAELAGLTEVTFFDVNNEPHLLSIDAATLVVIQVAAKYQSDFAKKQTLMTQIDSATIDALNAITWD